MARLAGRVTELEAPVRRLYRTARDSPGATPAARRATRARLEALTDRACLPGATADVPHRELCARLLKDRHELFAVVTDPAVPSTHNQAARDLRPLVIAGKVSGGTRSPQGFEDAMRRATLFATWRAQHLNPFAECRSLLLSPQL